MSTQTATANAVDINGNQHDQREIVTCGSCGKSWCGRCDGAPSALCHFCHGYGKAETEIRFTTDQWQQRTHTTRLKRVQRKGFKAYRCLNGMHAGDVVKFVLVGSTYYFAEIEVAQ